MHRIAKSHKLKAKGPTLKARPFQIHSLSAPDSYRDDFQPSAFNFLNMLFNSIESAFFLPIVFVLYWFGYINKTQLAFGPKLNMAEDYLRIFQ